MRIDLPPTTLSWALPASSRQSSAARTLDLIAGTRAGAHKEPSGNRATLPVEQTVEGELLREPHVIPPDRAAATRVFAGRASTVYDESGNTWQKPASPRAISAYLDQDKTQGAAAGLGSRVNIFA